MQECVTCGHSSVRTEVRVGCMCATEFLLIVSVMTKWQVQRCMMCRAERCLACVQVCTQSPSVAMIIKGMARRRELRCSFQWHPVVLVEAAVHAVVC